MKHISVNATSEQAATAAVREECSKRGILVESLHAVEKGPLPDALVAVVVTKPSGKRRTFNVILQIAPCYCLSLLADHEFGDKGCAYNADRTARS